MSTWAELRAAVRRKYKLAGDGEKSFKLVFEYEDQELQAVVVSYYEALGRQWCDVTAAACAADRLDPRDALWRNFEFAAGALCLDGDVYVVRYSAPLNLLCGDELDWVLQLVAATAHQIDRHVSKVAAG